ncbi:hypothetical protein CAPTEDRAFT_204334 [Capitella teleta]|uniref:DMA domain-containing protein n=1 Tax=Capitella teleta TaxID=283909 RepID=R7TDG3_CAPTE|nr:hypothetical protein CAPTEDRAFT_204334 [Capitella teleta]|eukprot:ELT91768.1 hypothetical protein CAPTEDRAFT_204334 [Capitella teleta]
MTFALTSALQLGCIDASKRPRLDSDSQLAPSLRTPSPPSPSDATCTSTPEKSEGSTPCKLEPSADTIPAEAPCSLDVLRSARRPKSLSTASALASSAGRRPPIEVLAKLFPHMKRSVLQLVLQNSGGDLVQAIEQVLHNQAGVSHDAMTAAHAMAARSFLTSAAGTSAGLKSAFSPINSVVPATSSSPMRYPYPPSMAARGLFAMHAGYPPSMLPNFGIYGAISGQQRTMFECLPAVPGMT